MTAVFSKKELAPLCMASGTNDWVRYSASSQDSRKKFSSRNVVVPMCIVV